MPLLVPMPESPESPKDESPDELDASRMPLWEHLGELRQVLIRSVLAFCAGLVVTYNLSEPIVLFLERPLLKIGHAFRY